MWVGEGTKIAGKNKRGGKREEGGERVTWNTLKLIPEKLRYAPF